MDRKVRVVSAALMAIAMLALSVSAVSAKTLKFNETITSPGLDPLIPDIQPQTRDYGYDEQGNHLGSDWAGPISGDINGMAYFWETDKNFVTGAKGGKVEHFFEDFLVVFSDGGWVIGRGGNGIFTFANKPISAKYRAEGRVTSASGDRQSFVGSKFFEEGIVTFPADPNAPWVGVGRGYIGP
jgi:hypothetical protein